MPLTAVETAGEGLHSGRWWSQQGYFGYPSDTKTNPTPTTPANMQTVHLSHTNAASAREGHTHTNKQT